MGRRAGFLRNVQAVLGLPNVEVEEAEMEKASPGRFDLICFRAFKPLDTGTLKGLFRLLKPKGILAAYKGRKQTAEAELKAATAGLTDRQAALPGVSRRAMLIPLKVPFLDEERHLVIIYR
jgi:16S rRNA (guanine527-N7)-methyltransferase